MTHCLAKRQPLLGTQLQGTGIDPATGVGLRRYRAKRDFAVTSEPKGRSTGAAQRQSGDYGYVVQKHAARRLHYDFRLELDGVLLSWAIPKGPSLVPTERRLAVRTD